MLLTKALYPQSSWAFFFVVVVGLIYLLGRASKPVSISINSYFSQSTIYNSIITPLSTYMWPFFFIFLCCAVCVCVRTSLYRTPAPSSNVPSACIDIGARRTNSINNGGHHHSRGSFYGTFTLWRVICENSLDPIFSFSLLSCPSTSIHPLLTHCI